MSGAAADWAGRVTRVWVRVYTTGLPRQVASERRAEIASDVWEHATAADATGADARKTAAQIVGRAVRGVPADLAWHLDKLNGASSEPETQPGLRLGAAALIGVLSMALGILFLIGLADGNWAVDDAVGAFYVLAVIAGIAGPCLALVGFYALRRAQADGASLTRPRVLLVSGTGGVALLGGAAFWTVIGPIVAFGILGYWVVQISEWRGERPVSP